MPDPCYSVWEVLFAISLTILAPRDWHAILIGWVRDRLGSDDDDDDEEHTHTHDAR